MRKNINIGVCILLTAIILQAIHMIEHLAQLYQYVILRLPITDAHGILFFLDLEQNHFYFNLAYFLILAYSAIKLDLFRKLPTLKENIYRYVFLTGFYIQGYHVLEHTARIGQYIQTGCTPCKGIIGWYFNGIYLHFTINFITLLLPMIAFFGLKMHKKILNKAR